MSKLRFLLLLWAAPLAGQQSPPPSGKALAAELWADLESVKWDASRPQWQSAHPQATCERFHEKGYSLSTDEEWLDRCAQDAETHTAAWFFYVFDLDEPLTSRLEQFRARFTGLPAKTLGEAQRELAKRLTERYGAGARLGKPGAGHRPEGRRWLTKDLQVDLYFNRSSRAPASLELLARHRHLVDALAGDQRLSDMEWGPRFEKALAGKLARELGQSFPNLDSLLGQDGAKQDQKEVQATLTRLLERAKTARTGRRPLLLLAADRLADHVNGGRHPASASWAKESKQLARYGLTYVWFELAGRWVYQRNLEQRLWHDYPTTEWGEDALVLLLNRGCLSGGHFANGSDQFRAVISSGEQFLASHPRSPRRLDVMFALAQAYETWWSLSQAAKKDPYVDSTQYKQGAPAARDNAVHGYDRIRQIAPRSLEALYARRKLPRLKLGIDTHQRRFYCLYGR